ncbi:MAG: hypothetical protein GOVbin1454_15 [Prokaryotic dsDNA virus sp.]|nr:MAG: hypothetical protein GOVbin1454_15 [Prokaryotic dsDNA virus sp.]|tara:strand:- start:1928 stop:2473 length:546 start_codon:yes stop_codon:yes gene_type:complete
MTIKPWPHNETQLPYVRGSDTSKEAADSMRKIAPSIEREVLGHFLVDYNRSGFTDDELEDLMGKSHQTVSARRRGLETKGVIEKTGMKRKTRSGRNANVYALVEGLNINEIENRLRSNKTIGRPKSQNPRSSRITIAFSKHEMFCIERLAKKEMVPVAQLVRGLLLTTIAMDHDPDILRHD